METRLIEKEQLRLLLEHQQDELDTAEAYEHLAGLASQSKAKQTFEELAADERHHASVFQAITGQELEATSGKRRKATLLEKLFNKNKLYKRLAEDEQESALRYEKLLDDFPELVKVKQDELRHFDMLLALME